MSDTDTEEAATGEEVSSLAGTPPPKVPRNYFGRGRDYIIPEVVATIEAFEQRYMEYSRANPDDPDGEFLLREWEMANPGQKYETPKPEAKSHEFTRENLEEPSAREESEEAVEETEEEFVVPQTTIRNNVKDYTKKLERGGPTREQTRYLLDPRKAKKLRALAARNGCFPATIIANFIDTLE